MDDPICKSLFLTILLAIVFFPYWWLAVVWSRTVITSPDVLFTFETTTFLLVLIILDGIFLFRYYQVKVRLELETKKEELKKSEALYRSIVTSSPDGIAISDSKGRIRMFSSSAVAMFGGSSERDFLGKPVFDLLHPEDVPGAAERMSKLLAGKNQSLNPFRGKRLDGSIFPNEFHSDVIRDQDGKPTDVVYIIRDVTEREVIQAQVRENEELFHTIFQDMTEPLLILDENGNILDTNKSCEDRLQINKKHYSNRDIFSCGLFFHEDRDKVAGFIKNSYNGGHLEIRMLYPDNSERFVILKVSKIRIRGLNGILLLVHDIDEIKRVQNSLSQTNNQLNILNSITRHDIINRVMIVTSYCEFLKEQITDETLLRQLSIIYESGENIKSLIEFTKEYQDLGGKEPTWQDVTRIFDKRAIKSLLIEISVHLPPERFEIFADPMLEKVIYNLIDNSRRHGQHVKNITISYKQDGEQLLLRYIDDGVGVPAADKPKLFEKGYGKNTGLGLFLIQEILKITNISIHEVGEPGKGACFSMNIPRECFRVSQTGLIVRE